MAPTAAAARATTLPRQRSRRRGNQPQALPLGSLTQRPAAAQAACHSCGSAQVTRLDMTLTDGTPVQFTSCHRCETRRWDHDGVELDVKTVLERTRKTA
ncbi:hypothetical protein [Thalassiella azotivora]